MSTILAAVSSVVTELITWVGQFTSAITSDNLLLLFCIVPLIFLGINTVRKLMNV